eukprot:CAMPEP_0184680108 /NCGR_PEP_ID=MMETSP0312-20130426/2970_1 /TAXON_ID=31354 /ORGANISM="Compsopogon coeruleus, Strain SAG 36.94" /LENGTH=290 /DNA_ID=CAMNT_0027129993 /DNA_START=522 /DNA_END=1394 /DNA_ORIENTATION=-
MAGPLAFVTTELHAWAPPDASSVFHPILGGFPSLELFHTQNPQQGASDSSTSITASYPRKQGSFISGRSLCGDVESDTFRRYRCLSGLPPLPPQVLPPRLLSDVPEVLAIVLAFTLNVTAAKNDTDPILSRLPSTPFTADEIPSISLTDYLNRIMKHAMCSNSCFITAHSLIERAVTKDQTLHLNSWSAHRILITAVMIAAKVQDDIYYNNSFYAKIGGLTVKELNHLELLLLKSLKFRTFVSHEDFKTSERNLIDGVLFSENPSSFAIRGLLYSTGFATFPRIHSSWLG